MAKPYDGRFDNPFFKVHSGDHPFAEAEPSQRMDRLRRDHPEGIPWGVCHTRGRYEVIRLNTGQSKYRYRVRKDGQPVGGLPVYKKRADAVARIVECIHLDSDT